jgi:nitrogen fixation protein FixH
MERATLPNPMLWILRARNQVPEFRITLAISPDTPTSDDTIVLRAHVSDADGQAVDSAQVELQAFVPGSQDAMRRVPMRALGQGDYVGSIHLGEAADWAMDVVAEKGWHSVRQRHSITVQPSRAAHPGDDGENDSNDD